MEQEIKYYMGYPVDKLPKGMLEKLQAEDTEAKYQFALLLRAYLKNLK